VCELNELVQLLLKYGAKPDLPDSTGETPIDAASGEPRNLMLQHLSAASSAAPSSDSSQADAVKPVSRFQPDMAADQASANDRDQSMAPASDEPSFLSNNEAMQASITQLVVGLSDLRRRMESPAPVPRGLALSPSPASITPATSSSENGDALLSPLSARALQMVQAGFANMQLDNAHERRDESDTPEINAQQSQPFESQLKQLPSTQPTTPMAVDNVQSAATGPAVVEPQELKLAPSFVGGGSVMDDEWPTLSQAAEVKAPHRRSKEGSAASSRARTGRHQR